MSDLMRCPFCGGRVGVKRDHTSEGADSIFHCYDASGGLSGYCNCELTNFACDMPVEELWNTRSPRAAAEALLADEGALERMVRAFDPDAWHPKLKVGFSTEHWAKRRKKSLSQARAALRAIAEG